MWPEKQGKKWGQGEVAIRYSEEDDQWNQLGRRKSWRERKVNE